MSTNVEYEIKKDRENRAAHIAAITLMGLLERGQIECGPNLLEYVRETVLAYETAKAETQKAFEAAYPETIETAEETATEAAR